MELRTEVEIDAPPSAVWEALLDTSRYQEWNPFITAVEGALRVGEHPNITLSLPDSGDMRIRPEILKVEPNQELRWRGKLLFPFLFSGEHFFRLDDVGAGRTRFIHGEDFNGWLVRYLGRKLAETARSFVLMNQALKRRVEHDPG